MFDFEDLTNRQVAFNKMKNLADELMNFRILMAGNEQYRLVEIEFYLYHKVKFQDGSTHKHPLQLTTNQWYFHRFPKSENFKPSNRIGIDLTCGNSKNEIYGGILIRAILNIGERGNYVYGPAKVVQQLQNDLISKPTSLREIENKNTGINEHIQLIIKELEHRDVYECPRYGLNRETAGDYFESPYRFITYGDKQHAFKEKTIFPYLKTTDYPISKILEEFNRKTI